MLDPSNQFTCKRYQCAVRLQVSKWIECTDRKMTRYSVNLSGTVWISKICQGPETVGRWLSSLMWNSLNSKDMSGS